MRTEWTKEMEHDLIQLRNKGLSWAKIPEEMSKRHEGNFTYDSCRNKFRRMDKKLPIEKDNKHRFREVEEIDFSNGTAKSDKLIELSKEKEITEEVLLEAHGFDPNEWEIRSVKNSMWHHHNKQDGTKVLIASRIQLQKRDSGLNWSELLDTVRQMDPIEVNIHNYKTKHKQLLEIPLFDQHFGINTYDDYFNTQARINSLITSRKWEQIVITIGSDMLHHNDHRNRTARGTEIEHVDMVQAWEDARMFYEPLIRKALKNSNNVKVYYIKGNHDESLSWAFTKMLEHMFPQVEFDTDFEERKVHLFKKVFIGYTHGDKGRNRLPRLFPAEFSKEWANARVRELHVGDIHHEVTKDEFGLTLRSLSTRARTDQWHRDNGWVGAHKRFMVFEYSEDELEAIHYV